MAPHTTGVSGCDHLRSMDLFDAALDFGARLLRPGGNFVVKLFSGSQDQGKFFIRIGLIVNQMQRL
jgi:23S rRNA U2552 (ribose-2'-O)-methylase RlmE/FtsJ